MRMKVQFRETEEPMDVLFGEVQSRTENDYEKLNHLPSINGIPLIGALSGEELQLQGQQGIPGIPGADGFSPRVTVTDIPGGHRVTVTDAGGTRSFDVMNGADGSDGRDGTDGAPGATGATPEIQIGTVTTLPPTQPATVELDGESSPEEPIFNFGIPQGQPGPAVGIDDTAGAGDTNLTWSADKLVSEFDTKGTYSKPSGGIPDSDIASAATWNGKANAPTALSLTLAGSSWSSATPPTQTVTATGVTASNNIIVGLASTATSAQYDEAAAAKLVCTAQAANSITVTCYGTTPTGDIPISVLIVG